MCPYKEVVIKVQSIFGALAETLKETKCPPTSERITKYRGVAIEGMTIRYCEGKLTYI